MPNGLVKFDDLVDRFGFPEAIKLVEVLEVWAFHQEKLDRLSLEPKQRLAIAMDRLKDVTLAA